MSACNAFKRNVQKKFTSKSHDLQPPTSRLWQVPCHRLPGGLSRALQSSPFFLNGQALAPTSSPSDENRPQALELQMGDNKRGPQECPGSSHQITLTDLNLIIPGFSGVGRFLPGFWRGAVQLWGGSAALAKIRWESTKKLTYSSKYHELHPDFIQTSSTQSSLRPLPSLLSCDFYHSRQLPPPASSASYRSLQSAFPIPPR